MVSMAAAAALREKAGVSFAALFEHLATYTRALNNIGEAIRSGDGLDLRAAHHELLSALSSFPDDGYSSVLEAVERLADALERR